VGQLRVSKLVKVKCG